MKKCLYCYEPLPDEAGDFHPACCKKIFKKPQEPTLPYSLWQMKELAKEIVQRSATVPGVQAKLSLHLEQSKQENRFTLVGLWGDFILKPPTPDYPQLPENEDLCMHLASITGIPVVNHSLIRLKSGELAYITRREDRRGTQKVHMEDMCQLTGKLTEQKYRGSMEQIGKVILKYTHNPGFDVLTFWEISVFSFLTGNADMHLKNFSLLYEPDGRIVLCPSYDKVSTRLVISEKDDPEEMALTLNGRKRKLKRKDFLALGNSLSIPEKVMENSFKRFEKNLPEMKTFIGKSFLEKERKEEFWTIILERFERLRK